MKVSRYSLWKLLISYVNSRIVDINSVLQFDIITLGIYDNIKKDTFDAGLVETCDKILTKLSELYDRVLEIKTKCAFIEEPKEKEDKDAQD